ncbi:hypothetical protein AUI06_01715 [archaeon 13_2_20CM_2_52_21]|nr:MAG: hypothetical protein AUI06_01715 [archaeon 13_2_20CM_2_52_21]
MPDPVTSHIEILSSLVGIERVRNAYAESVRHRYLWHEFATAISSGSNESKTISALLSWLRKVSYADPLAAGPKSSRLKFRFGPGNRFFASL